MMTTVSYYYGDYDGKGGNGDGIGDGWPVTWWQYGMVTCSQVPRPTSYRKSDGEPVKVTRWHGWPVTWWHEAPFLHRHFWRHSSPHLDCSLVDVIIIISMPIVMTIQMTTTMTCQQDKACHSRRLASQECANTAPTVLTSASLIITLSSTSKTWITLHGSMLLPIFRCLKGHKSLVALHRGVLY